jgi:hypothetical protein
MLIRDLRPHSLMRSKENFDNKILQKESSMRIYSDMEIDNEPLLIELALSLPNGAFADFGRRVSHAYEASYLSVLHDDLVQGLDKKITCGHVRWSYVNTALRDFAKSHDLLPKDVKMGMGADNHVELRIGRLVLTCHHVARGQRLPYFAKYLGQNAELNELLSQMELFQLEGPMEPSSKEFNVLILHDGDENGRQVNDIRFVFPRSGETLAIFSIGDIIAKQSTIEQLSEDEQIELKARRQAGQ